MEKYTFCCNYAGIKSGTIVQPASVGRDHIALHHRGGILYVPFGTVEPVGHQMKKPWQRRR